MPNAAAAVVVIVSAEAVVISIPFGSKEKQVRTNNDAAFQCNFIFNIFLFYGCYGFFLILLLTFKWFHLILQQIFQFLQFDYRHMYRWMGRQINRTMDRQTE